MTASQAPILLFDRTLRRRRRQQIHKRAGTASVDVLREWAGAQIEERLKDIKRPFPQQIILNDQDHIDEEYLPFKAQSLDMLISILRLHAVNDLPGVLIQIKRALKPDGLFMAALFGGETLYELRQSLTQAEMHIKGGISPRVFPFADKQQMGALLQRAGFALPVIDSERVTVTYKDMFHLMQDLRGMGESNIIHAREKRFPGKALFMDAARRYAAHFSDPDGRIRATFEIIFLLGWAPHDSQQKPLKPGSGQTNLKDVL